MSEESYDSLGAVLEACHDKALAMWRTEYERAVSLDDLLGYHVRAVKVASRSLPMGHLDVMVKIQPRANWQAEAYFWKFFKVGGTYHPT